MNRTTCIAIAAANALIALTTSAHEVDFKHLHGSTNAATRLKIAAETSGPVKTPAALKETTPTSGQGFWKFAAMKDLVPTPEETKSFLKGAHGTILVDAERDLVYWGLQKVGWVAFSNGLTSSWVVKGDPKFTSGNLHGADILPRHSLFSSKLPLVVSADNDEGEVYLSDTSFQHAQILGRPAGPYLDAKAKFMPTDAAFIDAKSIYVTDGYGSQWFMHATTEPMQFDGTFIGGNGFSKTPHGITKNGNSLFIAARPEATIKEYVYKKKVWLDSMGLPPGSTVCDVDLWGDYALAPCLDGPKGADGKPSHGPIYIINLKTKTIVSTIRVKDDLGYAQADHIHDAAWYVRGTGNKREVYILFTNWNPGGIGAVKLVNAPDAKQE